MVPTLPKTLRILLAVCALLFASPLGATTFRLDTNLIGQVRENAASLTESPVNGYLGLGFAHPEWWNLSGETDMRLFRDFSRRLDDYDLYQAVLHFQPLELLKVDFGRQFVSQGFSTEILDGIQTTIMPPGYVDIVLFTGIPRSVERGDFNENDGLLTGLSLALKNVERTNAQIHAAWRKNNVRFNDIPENDEVFVGANLSHRFDAATRPLLYGLLEYNVTGTNLDAGTAGVDITPAKWVSLNLEFNVFNVNRDSDRRTILGLFTQGRTYSGRLGSTWTLIPDRLDFVQSYSLQSVEIQAGSRRAGHLLDTAFQVMFDEIGLLIEPGYYFSKSFGGTVHGVRTSVHEQFTDRITGEAYVDFATYDKVTGKDDTAFSTVLGAGYEVVRGLTLSGGFEFNRNTVFDKDIRGTFQIEYHFNHGT